MKKSLIITILLVAVSTVIYAGGAKKGKNSSFGQWDYDKFPAGTQVVGASNAPSGYNSSDACYQYIHVNTKFHVRVKNWTRFVQLGLNGYAEMRASLGTAQRTCNIPYRDIDFKLYYDRKVMNTSGVDFVRVTMKGLGLVNECYRAIGFASTRQGLILPNGYLGSDGDLLKRAILNEEKGCYEVKRSGLYEITF